MSGYLTDSLSYNMPWMQPAMPTFNPSFSSGGWTPDFSFNPSFNTPFSSPSVYGWGTISSSSSSGSTSSAKDVYEYEAEVKKARKKERAKAAENASEAGGTPSKAFPETGLTEKHEEALHKLLKQMQEEGCNTPLTDYALKHGMSAVSVGMMIPMLKPVGNLLGGSATGQAVYKYTGAKWVAGKCSSGYKAVRNIKGIRHTADFISKHGTEKVALAARKVSIARAGAGDSAKLGLKAAATSTKTCATGLRYVTKFGGAFEAGMTVYDDKNKLVTAWKKDAASGFKQTGQTAAKAAGAGVGFWAGAKGGAALGATIGSFVGPVGTAVGGFLGGLIGGIAGAWAGKKLAQTVVGKDEALKIQEQQLKAQNTEKSDIVSELVAYVQAKGEDKIDPVALEALQILVQKQQQQAA